MRPCIRLLVTATLLLFAACDQLDNTDPLVTIVVPTSGAVLAPGNVSIKAVATDNKGVAKVEFYAGATKIGEDATGTADTFDISWTATEGAYTLKAVASDDAGNTAEHSINVTVQTGGGGTGPTNHSGRIEADETWWPSGNPHIITGDVYPVNNATLTIKPGCVVRFRSGTEMYCGYGDPGAIIAEGTADSVITFTSDVNPPSPGDWQEIGIFDEAVSTTRFRHCIFEYGGKDEAYGALHVEDVGLRVTDCTFRNNKNYAVRVVGNGYFIEFENNTVTGSSKYPVYIPCTAVGSLGTGNTLTGNTNDAILVKGGRITTTATWRNQGVPYVIENDIAVGDDANNPVLTIAPGTTIKLRTGVEFYCGYGDPGGIIADGTAGQITFTSAVNPPSPGDFLNIGLYDQIINSQTKFINCKIEFGGGENGNLLISNSAPTVTGCLIRKSASWGIYLVGDPANLPDPAQLRANNTFEDNASGDVREP